MPSSADGQDDRRSLPAAALVAVALHSLAIAGLTLWRPVPPITPPGQQEITIDLAPAMEHAEAVSPAEVSQPVVAEAITEPAPEPQPVESVQAPAETAVATPAPELQPVEAVQEPRETTVAAAPEADEAADAEVATTTSLQSGVPTEAPATTALALPPETQAIESTAPEAPIVAALPDPVQETPAIRTPPRPAPPVVHTRKPAPKQERPEQKPVVKPSPNPPVSRQAKPAPSRTAPSRSVAARQAPAAADARAGAASASREESRGSAAAADPNAMSRYAAQLAAALRARLRYPETARSHGIGGVATLRFTLHRSGRVVASSVVRSAGHAALDQAALATAAPGSSLPPAPDDIPQQQLTISVPLRFNLN
jgi:periplasmic protein TonB